MDITQCAVWSEHTCHADSPAQSAVFIPGKSIFLLLLAGETILLGVLVLNVRAAVPWSIGQLLAVLTVPFLTANNELLLLLRWVRPEWMMTGAVPLFAGQLCLLRFVQLSELPKGLPLAAGVLVLCMVLQCIRLAARSEYIAEA